ncbi:WNT1-inducible-signaling pathway protein 2 [Sigmodon hispidus]
MRNLLEPEILQSALPLVGVSDWSRTDNYSVAAPAGHSENCQPWKAGLSLLLTYKFIGHPFIVISKATTRGVCPAVSVILYLSLDTTPVPTGGAPGAGRLWLLPSMCAAAGGVLRPSACLRPQPGPGPRCPQTLQDLVTMYQGHCRGDALCGLTVSITLCAYEVPESATGEEDDRNCEVNGHKYLDGETFQPNCKVLCRCDDGGFTCLPLCSENVRLPSWDCPHPKRVEVPGRCCPEWVCDQGVLPRTQPYTAQGNQLYGLITPASADVPCPKWSTAWGPCSTTCGLGIATRVSNQNRFCQLEIQRRLCLPRPCLAARGRSSWNSAF